MWLACVWLAPSPAAAEPSVQFEYRVPEVCASRAAFIGAVGERLEPSARHSAEQRLNASVAEVRIDLQSGQGEVQFHAQGGATATRRTSGDNCEDLVTSLVLICAIALRSDAPVPLALTGGALGEPAVGTALVADAAGQKGNTEPAAGPPVASTVQVTPTADAKSRPLAQKPPVPKPPVPEPRTDVQSEASEVESRDARWALGAGARMDGWSGPANPLGLTVLTAFRPRAANWSLRGSASWMRSQASIDERSASFSVLAARAEVCGPVLRSGGSSVQVDACLALGGGAILASGLEDSGLLTSRSSTQPWLDAALVLRAVSPSLWGVHLEAQAELGSALLTHDFAFAEPEAVVFRVEPRLAPALGLGLIVPL